MAINNVLTDYYNANLQLMSDRLKKLNDKIDREIDGVTSEFEKVGDDGEGNIIGNCKLCGAAGVLVHNHKCETPGNTF